MAQFYLDDKEFGRVYINTRRSMKKVISKWKSGHLCISLPDFVSEKHLRQYLDNYRQQLRDIRPAETGCTFAIGDTFPCFNGYTAKLLAFNNQDILRSKFQIDRERQELRILLNEEIFKEPKAQEYITYFLGRAGKYFAGMFLIDYATEVAREIGVSVALFKIGYGQKRLGCCSSSGEISLSQNLVYYPKHLVRFVICHELGHITHQDHSAAFHALVNQYCDGREAELDKELKSIRLFAK